MYISNACTYTVYVSNTRTYTVCISNTYTYAVYMYITHAYTYIVYISDTCTYTVYITHEHTHKVYTCALIILLSSIAKQHLARTKEINFLLECIYSKISFLDELGIHCSHAQLPAMLNCQSCSSQRQQVLFTIHILQ